MGKAAIKPIVKGFPANSPPHTIDWELRLGFLIHDVSRMRRSAFDRYLKPMNLTRSQWWVIAYLSREDGMTQSQLAEELDLGKVAMGGLIDRLEKSGFVRRDSDASDRRVNRVFLEQKSKAIVNRMRTLNHEFNLRLFAGVPDADLEVTATTLDAMKRNIRNVLQGTEEGAQPAAGVRARPLARARPSAREGKH